MRLIENLLGYLSLAVTFFNPIRIFQTIHYLVFRNGKSSPCQSLKFLLGMITQNNFHICDLLKISLLHNHINLRINQRRLSLPHKPPLPAIPIHIHEDGIAEGEGLGAADEVGAGIGGI